MTHDLDRTLLEAPEQTDVTEELEGDEPEYEYEDQESGLDEVSEVDLASELMEVSDEEELEQFLGRLVRKVARGIRSPVGGALVGILKKAAKKALPVLGGAVGTYFGGPLGAAAGAKLAGAAGKAFGLELEGLSPQDQELEAGKAFVRFAGAAARNAVHAPPGVNPVEAAARAAARAARRYAPGLLLRPAASARPGLPRPGASAVPGRSGRWVRSGSRIVLFGVYRS